MFVPEMQCSLTMRTKVDVGAVVQKICTLWRMHELIGSVMDPTSIYYIEVRDFPHGIFAFRARWIRGPARWPELSGNRRRRRRCRDTPSPDTPQGISTGPYGGPIICGGTARYGH